LVEETGSRVAKTRFLASYFEALPGDEDLRIAVVWLTGSPPPPSCGGHAPKLDPATLRHALLTIPGMREERYREIHLAQRQPARTARLALQELPLHPEAADLTEAADFIKRFRETTGSLERIQRLGARLATLHPAEGETLVKLLTGDLQLGLDAVLVEDALAAAFQADPLEIQRAAALTENLAEAAVLARHRRLADACAPAVEGTVTSAPASPQPADLPFPSA
jgi:hypothetical protein